MCQTQNQIKFNWKSAQTADSMIHGAYIMAQTEWKISGYDLTCLRKKFTIVWKGYSHIGDNFLLVTI